MTPELKITWSVEPDLAKGTLRIKRILVEDFGEVPLTEAQPSGAYLVLDRLMKDRTFED